MQFWQVLTLVLATTCAASTLPLGDNLSSILTVSLPPVMQAVRSQQGAFQFGEGTEVNFDLRQQATFSENLSAYAGRVYRVAFESVGAKTLNLLFDRFHLPVDAQLFIIGHSETLGPLTHRDNLPSGKFSTWPMAGDRLRLELYVPSHVTEKPEISVSSVVHGFSDDHESGRCNIDVRCSTDYDAWKRESRAVAMMLTANGRRWCSGTMINNAQNDGRQLFLTADHCVSGNMDHFMLMFNYERTRCNTTKDGRTKQTVQGLRLLAHHGSSDYAIFEVTVPIPTEFRVFMAGFDASNVTTIAGAVGIHHPSGDVKKISKFNGNLTLDCYYGTPICRKNHWKIMPWSLGTTEPGSSGSGLFNQQHQVIGQLHGGTASCDNRRGIDLYGALHESWAVPTMQGVFLKDILDPQQTGSRSVQGAELATLRRKFTMQQA